MQMEVESYKKDNGISGGKMTVYYFVLALVIGIVFLSGRIKQVQMKIRHRSIDKDKLFLTIIGLVLILVSGLRYRVGTDYSAYVINYAGYKALNYRNFGVRLLAIIASWINDDYSTWFFLMALLTVGLCVYSIYKKKEYWHISIILYLFMGYWHASFNIVKQCAAMAIIIACQDFLIEKKFAKWAMACLAASLFHVSAIILIPVYFLVTKKINIKHLFLIVLVGVVISICYEKLFSIMAFLKSNEGLESISSAVGAREVNVLRVIVNVIPAFLMIFLKYNYKAYEERENDSAETNVAHARYDGELTVWSNMALLNAVISVAAQNSVYLTRFCYYTGVFNMFFIPFALSSVRRNTRLLIYSILLICYFIFWVYDLSKGSTTVAFHWIFER